MCERDAAVARGAGRGPLRSARGASAASPHRDVPRRGSGRAILVAFLFVLCCSIQVSVLVTFCGGFALLTSFTVMWSVCLWLLCVYVIVCFVLWFCFINLYLSYRFDNPHFVWLCHFTSPKAGVLSLESSLTEVVSWCTSKCRSDYNCLEFVGPVLLTQSSWMTTFASRVIAMQ